MRLLFPPIVIDYLANGRDRHAEHVRDLLQGVLASRAQFAYLAHLLPRQFAARVFFAGTPAYPATFNSIPAIVLLCAREKVARIAARRIIASVPNHYLRRSRPGLDSMAKFPRYAMRLAVLPTKAERAVAVHTTMSHPWPAGIRSAAPVYLGPETRVDRRKAIAGVPEQKAHRLALYVASASIGAFGYASRLATAAFAQFRGVEIEGKLNYTIHGIASYQVMPTPRLLPQRGDFLCLHYITLEARPC